MAAAGFGLRKSGKSRAKSSTQGWSPNSGQAAEDQPGSFVDVLVSEQGLQSSSSGLTLPQQHQQTGTQMQSAFLPLDQLQGESGQYQPTGNDQTPTPTGPPVVYPPSGNDLAPLAGANENSDAIVNAQLTQLISRDDQAQGQGATSNQDVLMPDSSVVRDIATPRRMSGGRCRKWCISAQPPTGKRKRAACCMCGTRFTHGEARLQQSCNRQTNHHNGHAHCVNGGLGHDHELHPKLADDQEAVDEVTRQRDTITRTAADTEVLLPFAQDPDQASTAAPPDDERDLFGREEALRINEEIMDFQCLNMSHGIASKTCVARHMSNLPRGSSLRCSKPNMPSFEPSLTTTPPHWRQSHLGKRWCSAAGSSWDDPQSTPLRANVHTAWMLDWSSFGLRIGLLFGPWYVPNAMLLWCRTRRAERTSSKCSHVFAKLLHWRVLVKKEELWLPPETRPQFQSLNKLFKSLYPTDPEPPAPVPAPVSALFLSEVAEHVPTVLRKMPRLSEPGTLGMRAEHWYDFGSLAGNSDLFVQVVAHIAAAAVPSPELQY